MYCKSTGEVLPSGNWIKPVRSGCRVSVEKTTVLRAGEERLLWATIHQPYHDASVLEPKEGIEAEHQILVARLVSIPENQVIPVRVVNLSATPTTLYQGLRLGNFCPLAAPDGDCTIRRSECRFLPLNYLARECVSRTSTSSQQPTS